jgi:hypothetical protein
MNFFLELLHSQRKKWSSHNKNALCESFFCVNDNGKMTFDALQTLEEKLKFTIGVCNYFFVIGNIL